MKGHNELHFNASTMIMAMQEYLDRALTDGHRVTVVSVTLDRTGVSTGTDAFVVHVEETKHGQA